METEVEKPPTPLQAWLALQDARGVKMRKVAADLGLDETVISHIRKGRRRLPRDKIEAAKTVTGLSAEDLLR